MRLSGSDLRQWEKSGRKFTSACGARAWTARSLARLELYRGLGQAPSLSSGMGVFAYLEQNQQDFNNLETFVGQSL